MPNSSIRNLSQSPYTEDISDEGISDIRNCDDIDMKLGLVTKLNKGEKEKKNKKTKTSYKKL